MTWACVGLLVGFALQAGLCVIRPCQCGRDVVVVTTVSKARTAKLILTSAVKLGMALRVYHERLMEGSSFEAECSGGQAECMLSYDLHEIYPWLRRFASLEPGSTFACALANAESGERGGYPRHARQLTAKAHFIFRKIAALRHAMLEARGYRVLVWADADVELRRPLDADFIAFATSVEVATIHRYRLPAVEVGRPGLDSSAFCDGGRDPAAYYAADETNRALPETGFATFNLETNASYAFVLAWAGYYGTSFARNSRCLNDICVWDRILSKSADEVVPDGLTSPRTLQKTCGEQPPDDAVASALLPPHTVHNGTALKALEQYVRETRAWLIRSLAEGWFAMCPEYWTTAISHEERSHHLTAENAAQRVHGHAREQSDIVSKYQGDIIAKYRVDMRRAHLCPVRGTADSQRSHLTQEGALQHQQHFVKPPPRVSPFHMYRYAVHAKGGDADDKTSLMSGINVSGFEAVAGGRVADGRRSLSTTTRSSSHEDEASSSTAVSRWRIFHNRFLSHPFDALRLRLDPFFEAAREAVVPVAPLVEVSKTWMGASFFEALVEWNASIGFNISAAQRQSTLPGAAGTKPSACTVDPDAVRFQLELHHSAGCCENSRTKVRYRMIGNVGLGSEISALLKPMAFAMHGNDSLFIDPLLARTGCRERTQVRGINRTVPSLTECLGLLPLDRCADPDKWSSHAARVPSASSFSRATKPVVLDLWRHKSFFWQTSMLVAYIMRPDAALADRVWRLVERMRGGPRRSIFAGSHHEGPRWRVLGIHVRRGDTCIDGSRHEIGKHKGRVCDDIDTYAIYAKAMIRKYAFDSIFVATDDQDVAVSVVERGKALFGLPRNRVFVNNPNLDRKKIYGAGYYNHVLKHLDTVAAVRDAEAVLDDIFVLAHCDGLVAKFTSNVARLAFALSNALKGGNCVIPFHSLDSTWCADYGRRQGRSVHGAFYC